MAVNTQNQISLYTMHSPWLETTDSVYEKNGDLTQKISLGKCRKWSLFFMTMSLKL